VALEGARLTTVIHAASVAGSGAASGAPRGEHVSSVTQGSGVQRQPHDGFFGGERPAKARAHFKTLLDERSGDDGLVESHQSHRSADGSMLESCFAAIEQTTAALVSRCSTLL
jgi:hypothetical protein